MHRVTCAFLSTLMSGILFSPSLLGGQTGSGTLRDSSEQRFAAINSSLLEAADSAIQHSADPQRARDPLAQAPQIQTQSITPSHERALPRINQRIDALQPLVQPILAKEGIPDQLAAVIRVESGGNPRALSPKGARGIWQLMPDTARRYGLRVNDRLDERLDLEKATTTAARYLKDLYVQFGSWQLALAAYNTGEVNLQRAINRAGSRDFSTLSVLGYLPLETRNYVPAVLEAMGSQFPSSVSSRQDVRPTRFVYATSEGWGQ